MKTPKLLPWYARKAGVSIDRATELWREAVRDATDKTGWVGNTEYWGEAMHGFIDLLEREQTHLYAPDMCSMVRTQNRLWSLPLTAMESALSAASAHWQRQMVNWRRQMNRTPRRTDCCSLAECHFR
jgi:hypothetical protein